MSHGPNIQTPITKIPLHPCFYPLSPTVTIPTSPLLDHSDPAETIPHLNEGLTAEGQLLKILKTRGYVDVDGFVNCELVGPGIHAPLMIDEGRVRISSFLKEFINGAPSKTLNYFVSTFITKLRTLCPSATQQHFSLALSGKGAFELVGKSQWESICREFNIQMPSFLPQSVQRRLFSEDKPVELTIHLQELPEEKTFIDAKTVAESFLNEIGETDHEPPTCRVNPLKKSILLNFSLESGRRIKLRLCYDRPSTSAFILQAELPDGKPLAEKLTLPNRLFCLQALINEACLLVPKGTFGVTPFFQEVDHTIQGRGYANPLQEEESISKALTSLRHFDDIGTELGTRLVTYLNNAEAVEPREHALAMTYHLSLAIRSKLPESDIGAFLGSMYTYIKSFPAGAGVNSEWNTLLGNLFENHHGIWMLDNLMKLIGRVHICSSDSSHSNPKIQITSMEGSIIARFRIGEYWVRCHVQNALVKEDFSTWLDHLPVEILEKIVPLLSSFLGSQLAKKIQHGKTHLYDQMIAMDLHFCPDRTFDIGTHLLTHPIRSFRHLGLLAMISGNAISRRKGVQHLVLTQSPSLLLTMESDDEVKGVIRHVGNLLTFTNEECEQQFCNEIYKNYVEGIRDPSQFTAEVVTQYIKVTYSRFPELAVCCWQHAQHSENVAKTDSFCRLGLLAVEHAIATDNITDGVKTLSLLWQDRRISLMEMLQNGLILWGKGDAGIHESLKETLLEAVKSLETGRDGLAFDRESFFFKVPPETLKTYIHTLEENHHTQEAFDLFYLFFSDEHQTELTPEDSTLLKKVLLEKCQHEPLEVAYPLWKVIIKRFRLSDPEQYLRIMVTRIVDGQEPCNPFIAGQILLKIASSLQESNILNFRHRQKAHQSITELLSYISNLKTFRLCFHLASQFQILYIDVWAKLLEAAVNQHSSASVQKEVWNAFYQLTKGQRPLVGDDADAHAQCWKVATCFCSRFTLQKLESINIQMLETVFKEIQPTEIVHQTYQLLLKGYITLLKSIKRGRPPAALLRKIILIRSNVSKIRESEKIYPNIDLSLIQFCSAIDDTDILCDLLCLMRKYLKKFPSKVENQTLEDAFLRILNKLENKMLISENFADIVTISALFFQQKRKKTDYYYNIASHLLELESTDPTITHIGGQYLLEGLKRKQYLSSKKTTATRKRTILVLNCLNKLVHNCKGETVFISANCLKQRGLKQYCSQQDIRKIMDAFIFNLFVDHFNRDSEPSERQMIFKVLWENYRTTIDFLSLNKETVEAVMETMLFQLIVDNDLSSFKENFSTITRHLKVGLRQKNNKETIREYQYHYQSLLLKLCDSSKLENTHWLHLYETTNRMIMDCIKNKQLPSSKIIEVFNCFVMTSISPTLPAFKSFDMHHNTIGKLIKKGIQMNIFKNNPEALCSYIMAFCHSQTPETLLPIEKQKKVLMQTIKRFSESKSSQHLQRTVFLFLDLGTKLFNDDSAMMLSAFEYSTKIFEELPLFKETQPVFEELFNHIEKKLLPKDGKHLCGGESNSTEVVKILCCHLTQRITECYCLSPSGPFDQPHDYALERTLQMLIKATHRKIFNEDAAWLLRAALTCKPFAEGVYHATKKTDNLRKILYLIRVAAIPNIKDEAVKRQAQRLYVDVARVLQS